MAYASPGKNEPFSTFGKHWPTLKCRPVRAKSCVALFTLKRRMQPLNSTNFDINSIGNIWLPSATPPTYITLAAFNRRGSLMFSWTNWPASPPICTWMFSILFTLLSWTWCHWPSFNLRGIFSSSRLRPRTINCNWPLRNARPMKCFGLSLVPYESCICIWLVTCMHHHSPSPNNADKIKNESYRRHKQQPIWIKCAEIELDVEVLLP